MSRAHASSVGCEALGGPARVLFAPQLRGAGRGTVSPATAEGNYPSGGRFRNPPYCPSSASRPLGVTGLEGSSPRMAPGSAVEEGETTESPERPFRTCSWRRRDSVCLGARRRCCIWLPLPAVLGQRGAAGAGGFKPDPLPPDMQYLNSHPKMEKFILCPREI